MKEILHQSCVNLDQTDYYFQISLKAKNSQFCFIFDFQSIEYSLMESYDFFIQYYSFNGLIKKAKKINLREIINLFIAEGLYKFQANYMNSKVNQSDFDSICNFIVYKIKTSNYANFLKDDQDKQNDLDGNLYQFIQN